MRSAILGVLLTTCAWATSASGASAQAHTKWYLAEGATGGNADFVEWILIANPSAVDTHVRITFLTQTGTAPPPYELLVKATSRATVRVNDVSGLSNAEVSAVVESLDGVDIVVERTMAWPRGTLRGAHNSTGVTSPATAWYLAEGSTGFFNTFILIANPDDTQSARIKVTFLKADGETVTYKPDPGNPSADEFDLAPHRRYTVWPNAEVPELAGGQAFGTVVSTSNGVGVIAERSMYWDTDRVFEGGHESVGVTQASLTWLFSEGTTKTAPGLEFNTFLLLANPNTASAHVRVSFYTAPGIAPLQREYDLRPLSRFNIWCNLIPELVNKDFSMKVESLAPAGAGAAQPVLAERSVYWGPGTGPPFPNWIDGHNTPGVTAEAGKWAFAEGLEEGFSDAPGLNFDSYFLISNSSTVTLSMRATFVREDGTGIVRDFNVPAESRFTLAGFQFPELTNQRFAAFFETLNDVPFVAERAVYWGSGYFAGHGSTGVPWTGTIATPPAVPAPTVISISPAQGTTLGGTPITITGADFTSGAVSVSLGGRAASNVSVVNATTITAVTAAAAGNTDQIVDVVVTNNGTVRSLPAAFTYVAPKTPVITGISPLSGPSIGGTVVTITGQHFLPGSTVTFGGIPAVAVTISSATQLLATTPPYPVPNGAGSSNVAVIVTSASMQGTSPAPFSYYPYTTTMTIVPFGDSITVGTIAINCPPPGQAGPCLTDDTGRFGYPPRLEGGLVARYTHQTIEMRNEGRLGEYSFEGVSRLPTVLRPGDDLLILMEGANDAAANVPTSALLHNLRVMAQTAQAAGMQVIMCTVTPVTPDRSPGRVAEYNEGIRDLADFLGVPLADFYTALGDDRSMLSADGLHPSTAGYQVMANLLYDIIVREFEGGQ